MRLSRWHWWLIGSITLVTGMILLGMSWFYSTADIRRVQAYANAAGISTTWKEAGFPAPTVAEQTAIRDFSRLAGEQKSLRTVNSSSAPRQIDPANAALREHVAAIPERFWRELDATVDALPMIPGSLYERVSTDTQFESLGWQRDLVRLQAERIQCCPLSDLPQHVARAVRLGHPMRVQTLIQQLVDMACASIISSAISSRLPEITEIRVRHDVAETLRLLNLNLWDARKDASKGEVAMMFLHAANYREVARLMWPSSKSRSSWKGIRDLLRYPLRLLTFRLNRELDLRHLIDMQVAIGAAKDAADLFRLIHAVPTPVPRFGWLAKLADTPSFVFGTAISPMLSTGLAKQQLVVAVIIADLTEATLPSDPFSASGAALNPVERIGTVIGWYSVGPDGTDDGGVQGSDFGIPLRASFGKPRFADVPVLKPTPATKP